MAGSSSNNSYSQNQAQNQSQNTASSQSTSTSFIPNFSQTPMLEQFAQTSADMAPEAYNWGMQQWANNQGDINSVMADAKRYMGQPQQAVDMGAAEARVTGAGEAAKQNSIRDLQSYGIDPSAGRYQALDRAANAQNAAAAAGAGNVQRESDMAKGQTMKQQAIAGELQNANFGNQVGQTANAFMGTAMRLPYSPLGTMSQSSSASQGSSSGSSSGYSVGSGGSSQSDPAGGGGSGGGGHGGGGQKQPQQQQPKEQQGQGDPPAPKDYSGNTFLGGGSGGGPGGGGGGMGPDGGGGGFSPGAGLDAQPWDQGPIDNSGGWDTPGSAGPNDPTMDGGDFSPQMGPSFDTMGGDFGGGGGDGGGGGGEYRGGPIGYAAGGEVDPDADGDQDVPGGYDPDQDGPSVGREQSPTGGRQIDDVPAKLTAGEFVMPDDVVRWKGEEYFQKLISQSRSARENIMAVHGQTQGQSHNLGGAI